MPPFDPERLLANQAWLARLATRLARDTGEAEDLLQETWLTALRGDAPAVRDPRAWLGTILRNAARGLRRTQGRRIERETAAARGEHEPAADAVVARLQEQRVLLAELERLEEPYRTTLLLRFFEELPPRAIATRTSVPVETVKTRLKRGLARLRERLIARHGSRDAWLLACAPLLRAPAGGAFHLVPTLLMKTELKLTAIALLLGGGVLGLFAWQRDAAEGVAAALPAVNALAAAPPSTAPDSPPVAPPGGREELRASSAPGPEPELVASAARRIHGRAFDAEGQPLAQRRVAQRGAPATRPVFTGADGRFELELASGGAAVVLDEPGWTTVLFGTSAGGEHAERIVVAAPLVSYSGRVRDETGAPVASARLVLEQPPGFRARFPAVLDYSGREYWIAVTDEEGRFTLAACPRIEGSTLDADRAGFAAASFALDARTTDLELVLQRLATGADALRGRVLDVDGAPAPGVNVAAGEAATQTLANGEFALPRAEIGAATQLGVVKRGYRPLALPIEHDDTYLLVRLTGPALALEGRLVNDDGAPVAGARVWVADPSWFGMASDLGMEVTAEGLAAARLTRADVEASFADSSASDRAAERFRAPSMPFWSFARSDEHGRFRIEGLAERDYTVRALELGTLQRIEAGPFAAGRTDLELVLPADGVWAHLRGRVVDPEGLPVAGAALDVGVTALAIDRGAYTTYRGETRGDQVVTDAEGRFELADVPKCAALVVTGDHLERLEFGARSPGGLEALVGANSDDVLVHVAYRYHLRIDYGSTPGFADSAQVLDEAGTVLWCDRIEGESTYGRQTIELHEGQSGSWNVSAAARTLVLLEEGREVRRVPLWLVPKEENRIVP